jgi:alpha-L-rhamnosidase
MPRIGGFDSSHDLLNQLHRNVVWSMRGNFVGVPTDCPQRDERLGWTGDINAFGSTAAYLYDVSGVLESWLQDLAAEQQEKGFVPFVVPDAMGTFCPPTALWGDVAVSLPWTLYQEYGDSAVLERQYPSMRAFLAAVEAVLDPSGLWNTGFQFGDWLDPDAPASNPAGGKTDPALMATAYLYKVTAEMSHTARVLGRTDDENDYIALHERVGSAFRHEWVSPAGLLVNESATAYALAICFGLLDDQQRIRAGRRLAELVGKAGFHISTGFAGTPLVAHALSQTNQLDTAYRLLLQTSCPSFLYPVTQGATTIWERWDAILPDGTLNDSGMTSLNHYALGAIADWLHKVVAGLSAAEPGYRRIDVAPAPGGGLTHASAWHETPLGRAEVSWTIRDGRFFLEAVIPNGSTARVLLPAHPEGRIDEVGGGRHRWEYDLPIAPRPTYSFDTPLTELTADEKVWRALMAVFSSHFPGAMGAGNGGSVGSIGKSLRDILVLIPGDKTALESELLEALEVR